MGGDAHTGADVIGRLIRAWEAGRRDARAGRLKTPVQAGLTWRFYNEAWERERLAMRNRGELPQLELGLSTETA